VTGKGGKRATVLPVAGTVAALRIALQDRSSDALLLDSEGERLDRHGATRVIRRLANSRTSPTMRIPGPQGATTEDVTTSTGTRHIPGLRTSPWIDHLAVSAIRR
jgi:hypothetical protein